MRRFGILLIALLAARLAWGETLEMVTYYPSPAAAGGNFDRLHANRATIGAAYNRTNVPDANVPDGNLFVSERVGIGTTAPNGPLTVVGEPDTDSLVSFLPGAGTGRMRMYIGTPLADPDAYPAHRLFVYDDEATAGTGALGAVATGVGTGTSYAGFFRAQGQSLDNVGLRLEAVNGTRNAALWVPQGQGGVTIGMLPATGSLTPGPPPNNGLVVGGRVGVGLSAPDQKLHVVDDGADNYVAEIEQSRAGGTSLVQVNNTAPVDALNRAGMELRGRSSTQEREMFRLESRLNTIADATRNSLTEFVQNATTGVTSSFATVMALNGANVGVGTTDPLGGGIPAPPNAVNTGNLNANDVYLRASGQWASSGGQGARMNRSTVQSIPQNTWTKVLLNSEAFDTAAIANPVTGTLTIQRTGKYLVTGGWSATLPVGSIIDAAIRVNGSAVAIDRAQLTGSGSTGVVASVTDVLWLTAGAQVELWVAHYQSSSVNTLTGASDVPRLSVVQI